MYEEIEQIRDLVDSLEDDIKEMHGDLFKAKDDPKGPCPFWDLIPVDEGCIYMKTQGHCCYVTDPRNSDAWCREAIEAGLFLRKELNK